eukprot:4967473-Amphidinium_carterae.1
MAFLDGLACALSHTEGNQSKKRRRNEKQSLCALKAVDVVGLKRSTWRGEACCGKDGSTHALFGAR